MSMGLNVTEPPTVASLLRQYGCGPIKFAGTENALYERHLIFDDIVDANSAGVRERYEAVARSVRDVLAQRWLQTERTYERVDPKRVYYLSLEFLIGRSLVNNITNLRLDPLVQHVVKVEDLDWLGVLEEEPDAGLGNGGLGRLAACFLDSMATLQLPAIGYGLRYEYGIFRQSIVDGWQHEEADNWLRNADPWEVPRLSEQVEVPFNCSFEIHEGTLRARPGTSFKLIAIPYDRPVVGYGGRTINTLRLWGAAAPHYFDFHEFSSGDFVGALADTLAAESVTRVLYPDDSTSLGQGLRFVQEYFLVAATLRDIVRRFRRANSDWRLLPEKAAIQMNDTHPALAVVELMRVLVDEAKLEWSEAWDITRATLGYTNHTLLPEALETWPVRWFELLIPRHLEIAFEINRRFLDDVRSRYPGDEARVGRMSLVDENGDRSIRMANLAIVGAHSTNGVAAIHTDLLRKTTVKDFADMFPERFNNKTNGVTPRRWLYMANPELSAAITHAIGDGWITDLSELAKLAPIAADRKVGGSFIGAKGACKQRFADWLRSAHGVQVDPETIFDCQVKRIHEYKRQLLNVLRIVVLYNRLKANPNLDLPPRTFFFAGKAAPAYRVAKLIIKLVNNIANTLEADRSVRDRMRVVFLPEYCVSLAERLIPAADVSNQISTAGYEASGTSNMKFMMNGALTIGTRDGATIEMAEEAGEENFFLFGLTAQQVADSRGYYSPMWHYENDSDTRAALDAIFGDRFSPKERGVFEPLRGTLLTQGDYYMHLADLQAYVEADQKLLDLYRDPYAWAERAMLNVAGAGKFSSDRTIAEYARDVWNVTACPV